MPKALRRMWDRVMDDVRLKDIRVMVWDLDITLGRPDGWDGEEPLVDYIYGGRSYFKPMLQYLKDEWAIKSHVLVTRNSMACGDDLADLTKQARALGFDSVPACPRKWMTRCKSRFVPGNVPAHQVLLLDDLEHECQNAARDGAVAIRSNTRGILSTLQSKGGYDIFYSA